MSIDRDIYEEANAACNYALKKQGVFPLTGVNTKEKIEAKILQHPYFAAQYAAKIIGGVWPEAEDIILTDNSAIGIYVQYVIKGRWEKAEKIICKNPVYIFSYLSALPDNGKKNTRWIEAEDSLLKSKYPQYCLQYAFFLGERWEDAEPIIASDPEFSLAYIERFIKSRWRLAENAFLKSFDHNTNKSSHCNCRYGLQYITKFLKARWLRAEDFVRNNDHTWDYTQNVLQPWFNGKFGIVED